MKSKIVLFALIFSCVSVSAQQLGSILHNGELRNFTYHAPSNWDGISSLPLLCVLHGLTQTGSGVMNITQFNALSEQEDFIVVYPSGLNNAWNANMNVSVSAADDIGFIESLFQFFESNFHTIAERRYLCGFSNGAFMCHKLACESNLCYAGIASVSGTMSDTVYNNCVAPLFPTSVLHIHGTLDAVVPYSGSPTTGISVDQLISKWSIFLNCNSQPNISDIPNVNLLDLSTCEKQDYDCQTNNLQLVKITGGGHQWPGINTWNGGVGTINMDFYSPSYIWDFLKTKTCQTTNQITELKNIHNIYPNPSTGIINFTDFNQFSKIEVFDLFGKLVFNVMNLEGEHIVLPLNQGSYNVKLTSHSKQIIWRKVCII